MNTQISEAISRQIKKIENSILNQTNEISITNYKSPNDPEYIQKLENAMKKNFDYIIKKDSMIIHGANMNSSSIKSVGVVSVIPQWQNIYNPKLLSNIPPPPAPPKQSHRLGIGTQHSSIDPATTVGTTKLAQNNNSSSSGSQSIYISKLPTDITQEELEILFGVHSKIKKIKIYMSQVDGKPKGDALITYYKPEDAITACLKFNQLDIGEGHVLNVVRADFSSNTKNDMKSEHMKNDNITISHHQDTDILQSSSVVDALFHDDVINNILSKLFADILPTEMEVYSYPVVVICNVFDQNDQRIQCDPNFLTEIETDMLVECCMHGNVRIMQVLPIDETTFNKIRQIGSNISSDGAIAVTYEDLECAMKCAKALDDRWFDSKQLYIELIFPRDPSHTSKLPLKSIPPPPPPKIPKPIHLILTEPLPPQFASNQSNPHTTTTFTVVDRGGVVGGAEKCGVQVESARMIDLDGTGGTTTASDVLFRKGTHSCNNLKGILDQESTTAINQFIDDDNSNTTTTNMIINNTNVDEVEDVEDFLNSLL